jgi:hypothetical protein
MEGRERPLFSCFCGFISGRPGMSVDGIIGCHSPSDG